MAKVNPIPRGQEGPIPHLFLQNAAKAVDFYKQAFGAEEIFRFNAPDGRIQHGELSIGGAVFYYCDDFPEMCGGKPRTPQALGGSPVILHRYVTDVDSLVNRAKAAGANVTMPPQDMFWGDRYAMLTDPFGHTWSFATHQKDVSPEEIAKAAKQFTPDHGSRGAKPAKPK